MSIGSVLEKSLLHWRRWRMERIPGPLGQWHRDNGESKLSDNLPVRSGDVVIDAGGYQGDWAALMAWRYGCSIIVVEPVSGFYNKISSRFLGNDRVQVVHAALSDSEGTARIAVDAAGSSVYGTSTQVESVRTMDVVELLHTINQEIGCLKINIEGGEYDVLERIITAGLQNTIRSFLIQFHRCIPECEARRARIRDHLSESHRLVLDYAFVWERWELGPHL